MQKSMLSSRCSRFVLIEVMHSQKICNIWIIAHEVFSQLFEPLFWFCFQELLSGVIVNKPEDPLEYMIKELRKDTAERTFIHICLTFSTNTTISLLFLVFNRLSSYGSWATVFWKEIVGKDGELEVAHCVHHSRDAYWGCWQRTERTSKIFHKQTRGNIKLKKLITQCVWCINFVLFDSM